MGKIAAANKSTTRCVVETVRVQFGPNAPGGKGFYGAASPRGGLARSEAGTAALIIIQKQFFADLETNPNTHPLR
jgi:hypothetical protein